MSELQIIKKTLDELGQAFQTFKESHTQQIQEVKDGRDDVVLREKVERVNAAVETLNQAKDDLQAELAAEKQLREDLEARLKSGGATATPAEKQAQEYRAKFDRWIRSNEGSAADPVLAGELKRAEKDMLQLKEVSGSVAAEGGYAVPEEINRNIRAYAEKFSPLRQAANVVQVGTSDYKELLDLLGEASGWVGEKGTRTETATATLRERVPTMGTLYAYPKATEESLDDLFFSVEGWLTRQAGRNMAKTEGIAFLSGDGTNKPTGFLDGTPTLVADFGSPLRGAEALQYIALSSASPAVALDNSDALIDMVYALNSDYRTNAQWAFNSATTGAIRKLKYSGSGEYIWQPGLQMGQPAMLLGYPVLTLEQMPDIAADAFPVAFADWEQGYTIVDRVGQRISVDANITTPGYVKWYIRRRVGGILFDNNAIKLGKIE